MRLTLPPLQINPDDPFNEKDDIFGRKEFAERLANLIKNSEDESLVISLDAQWGEGKTTFINMFNAQLEKEGATTIYFDAFAHDYVSDSFTAITGEIYSKLKNKIPDKNLIDNLQKISGKVLSIVAQAGGNQIGLGDFFKNIIDNRIKKYEKDKKSIKSFKKELENLAKVIKNEPPNKQQYPLVFIVDELDRCKPIYALDVIEKIKHFFSVKNVVFILVMNKRQMEDSIKSIYGTTDASTYLQKFVNIESSLHKNTYIHNINDYIKYAAYLYGAHKLPDNSGAIQSSIIGLSQILNLSLREMERCYTYLSIFYSSIKDEEVAPELVGFLIIMKVKYSEIYNRLKTNNISFNEYTQTEFYSKINSNSATANKIKQSRMPFLELILQFYLFNDNELASNGYNNLNHHHHIIKELYKHLQNLSNTRQIHNRLEIIPFWCKLLDSFEFVS